MLPSQRFERLSAPRLVELTDFIVSSVAGLETFESIILKSTKRSAIRAEPCKISVGHASLLFNVLRDATCGTPGAHAESEACPGALRSYF